MRLSLCCNLRGEDGFGPAPDIGQRPLSGGLLAGKAGSISDRISVNYGIERQNFCLKGNPVSHAGDIFDLARRVGDLFHPVADFSNKPAAIGASSGY